MRPLRRARGHHQFLLLARRLPSRGAGGDGQGARARGHRRHRSPTRWPASCAPISPPRRSASSSWSASASICKMHRACSSIPSDRAAYGRLCRLLTLGQRRAEKGQCTLYLDDVAAHAEGLIFIALPPEDFAVPLSESLHRNYAASNRRSGRAAALSRGAAFLSRRRSRPHRGAWRDSPSEQACPSSPPMRVLYHAPHRRALAGRAHLHPREMHDSRSRASTSKPMQSAI